MVTKITAGKEYIYGIAPVPIDPDDLPDRIPIDMKQLSTIEKLTHYLQLYLDELGADISRILLLSSISIRYDPLNRRLFVAPDIYISFDVDAPAISEGVSYNLWEVGKPPEFALEVASPSTYQNDLHEKPGIYERIGISEYWLFDSTGGKWYGRALSGYRLVNGIYEPIEITLNEHGLESGYSEVLNLRLCSLERDRHSELGETQQDLVFREDYNRAQLLLQYPESGEYILGNKGLMARIQRIESERDAERAERERLDAENARLRERLRSVGRD